MRLHSTDSRVGCHSKIDASDVVLLIFKWAYASSLLARQHSCGQRVRGRVTKGAHVLKPQHLSQHSRARSFRDHRAAPSPTSTVGSNCSSATNNTTN